MTASFADQTHHAIRAGSVVTVKPPRVRFRAGGLAALVGAALVVFATTALAQSAADVARAESAGSGAARPPSAIRDADPKGRSKSSAAANLEYYSVPGTAFHPVYSSTTYAYANNGCIYATGGNDILFQAPLILPLYSTIVYYRFYYYDASVADMYLFLNKFSWGVGYTDLAYVPSGGTAGFGAATSADLNLEVDTTNNNYVLTWSPTLANNGQQICGARVAYYPLAAAAAPCTLDADGNGAVDALTDGLLIIRAMFGLTGTAVTNNAIGSGTPSRTTWTQLRNYFNGSCGANFAQ